MSPQASIPVAVIGGGIAGCSAAIALQRAGRPVLVLEGAPEAVAPIGETLPSAAKPLLRELGVWDAFTGDGHLPSAGTVSLWGGPEPVVTDAILDPHGGGWQVDRRRLGGLLRRSVVEAGGRLIERAVLEAAERADGGWRLRASRGTGDEGVVAGLVIDASGRRSAFARMAGASRQYADNLACRHARFGGAGASDDRDSRTWVEAVEGGWWYSARVPGDARVVAFLTDGDLMPESMAEAAGFVGLLSETQGIRRLVEDHRLDLLDGPHTTAARSSRLLTAGGEGWIAAGDAALAFDPLAGRGMWAALRTGLWAAGEAARAPGMGYQERLDRAWGDCERMRVSTYATETRWTGAPFWRRRLPAG